MCSNSLSKKENSAVKGVRPDGSTIPLALGSDVGSAAEEFTVSRRSKVSLFTLEGFLGEDSVGMYPSLSHTQLSVKEVEEPQWQLLVSKFHFVKLNYI